jgi:hypothetical protein
MKYIVLILLCSSCVSNAKQDNSAQLRNMERDFVYRKQLEGVVCGGNGVADVCFAQTKEHTPVKFICNIEYTDCYFPID